MIRAIRDIRRKKSERKVVKGYETDTRGCLSFFTALIIIFIAGFGITPNASAQFTVTTCTDCHASPPDDGTARDNPAGAVMGSHAQHETYSISCTECHVNNTATDHRDGKIELNDPIQGGSYSKVSPFAQTNDLDGSGLGTCSNIYCHGDYAGSGLNASPTWGTTSDGDCGTCHNAKNTQAEVITSGSHERHVGDGDYDTPISGFNLKSREYDCTMCHDGIVAGSGPDSWTVSDQTKHVSGKIDWEFDTTDPRLAIGTPSYSIASGSESPSDGTGRAYGSCTVYCHSNVQPVTGVGPPDLYETARPGPFVQRKWGDVTGCYGCHVDIDNTLGDNPVFSGNRHREIESADHPIHIASATSDNTHCLLCHNWSNTGWAGSGCGAGLCHLTTGEKTKHADGNVDLIFKGKLGGVTDVSSSGAASTYDGGSTPGDGFGACSNIYCHTEGTGIKTGSTDYTSTTPQWGSGSTMCNSCHGTGTVYGNPDYGMPDYANEGSGNQKRNAHPKHIAVSLECTNCHRSTTQDNESIWIQSAHVNGYYTTLAYGSYLNKTIAFTNTLNSGICSLVSCHGNNAIRRDGSIKTFSWGAGELKCYDCHVAPVGGDVDDYTYGNGTHARIWDDEWFYSGHGKETGNYDVSNNPAANLWGSVTDQFRGEECKFCHTKTVDHDAGTNPFRLANLNALGNGINDVCLICHGTGSSGYDPDTIEGTPDYYALKTATVKIDKHHAGSKHGASNDGGTFCWDCHDPHGDSDGDFDDPIMMVQTYAARNVDQYGVPEPGGLTSFVVFYDNSVGFGDNGYANNSDDGICQVCHTQTLYYKNDGTGAAHETDVCTNCHKHSIDTVVNSEAFGASCDACHGNPPSVNSLGGPNGLADNEGGTGSSTEGAHVKHAGSGGSNLGYVCETCHTGGMPASTVYDKKIQIGFNAFSGYDTTGTYDGRSSLSNGYTYEASAGTTVNSGGTMGCSNIYCHGDFPGSGNTSNAPEWDDPTSGVCGTCHGAENVQANVPDSGSHARHAGDGDYQNPLELYTHKAREYDCTQCHDGIISGSGPSSWSIADASKHINTKVDWAFDETTAQLLRTSGLNDYTINTGDQPPSDGTGRLYGSCTVYCHSRVQTATGGALTGAAGEFSAPQWGETYKCYGCHVDEDGSKPDPTSMGEAIDRHREIESGNHPTHLAHTNNPENVCFKCHDWNPSAPFGCTGCHLTAEEKTYHVNGIVDIIFRLTEVGPDAAYSGTGAPGDGFGTCSDVSCHSDGTDIKTNSTVFTTHDGSAVVTPVWGTIGTLNCNSCHGNNTYGDSDWRAGMPEYANAPPKRNAHVAHVIDAETPVTCRKCHAYTTLDGLTIRVPGLFHGDGKISYQEGLAGTYLNKTVDFNAQASGGCSGISCHGGWSVDETGTAKFFNWGDGYIRCYDCHVDANTETVDYTYGNGTHAKILDDEWDYSGHGKTSGTYDISDNPAANLWGNVTDQTRGEECKYCHTDTIQHNQAGNPFRLANLNALGNGDNDVCLICHGTSGSGYDPDTTEGTDYFNLKTATVKIDKWHAGTDHGASNDGGSLCWDCHDPHGDRDSGGGNIYMIHDEVVVDRNDATGMPQTTASPTFINNAAGTDYIVEDPGPFTGVCNVCHTQTNHHRNDGLAPGDWDGTPGSSNYIGHNNSTDCSTCHDHSGDTTVDEYAFKPSGECDGCHDGVPGGASYVTRDVFGITSPANGDFTQSSRHVFGGTVTNWDCIVCHREGDATQAASGTVGTTSLHGNGGTPVVDLRNVDSINAGWTWDKYDGTCSNVLYDNINDCVDNAETWTWSIDSMLTDMDSFCMSCHDSDGASGINVKATDDGVHLDNTRASTPFNSTDGISSSPTQGGTVWQSAYERTSVLDVYTQFDPNNPSHHAVRGKAYNSHNPNWGDTAWVNKSLKSGQGLMTEYEASTLHCADCHTTDQNAHGGANGFMLEASSIDATCYLCHNSATYSNNNSSETRWDHSNDGQVWDEAKGSKLGQYGANGGSICLNCHGGNPVTDGFGGIHGLPSGTDSRSGQERYRFQGGSYMSHDPGSWTGTTGSATCYFAGSTDTQDWSSCTKHDAPETDRTASPQHSREVPPAP